MADQERRWDDLEGRWVVLSQGRQGRPVLEAGAGLPCPFCPGPEGVSELPQGDYRVAVFENRYPPLGGRPAALPDVPWGEGQTAAPGRAEVVVYSPSHGASLGDLPEAHLADLIWVWADRTWEGLRDPGVAYVFVFENRGSAVGATVDHPHGQIYHLPFVPPRIARLGRAEAERRREEGECPMCRRLRAEEQGPRWLEGDPYAGAYASFAPRFPYQLELVPRRCAAMLYDLREEEVRALARLLRRTVRRLDGLWGSPMPYMLGVLQGTPRDLPAPRHLRLELAPLLRAPGRRKVLAASESLGETFLGDVLPEEAAQVLRATAP